MKHTLSRWRDKVLQHCISGLDSIKQIEINMEKDKKLKSIRMPLAIDGLKQAQHEFLEIIDHLN